MAVGTPLLASILILTSFGPPPETKTRRNALSSNSTSTDVALPIPNKLILLVKIPTVTTRVKIFCRTGYHLVVLPGGLVRGSINNTVVHKFGRFELQSYAPSVIRIKSLATQRYVGIGSTGKVFSTVIPTNETLYREKLGENYFHSFRSTIYEGKTRQSNRYLYLAIKQNGLMKNARRVLPIHKSYQFLTIGEEDSEHTRRQQSKKLGIDYKYPHL